MPMGFCYPGRSGGGDAPPRAECVHLWRDQLLQLLPDGAAHPACRKLRSAACPWAGGDYAAGEKLPRLSPGLFPASASVVEIENVGGEEPMVPRGRLAGTSLCNRAGALGRSGAEIRGSNRREARRLPCGNDPICARKPLFGSGNLVLRKFGRRNGRPRIHRSSGSLRGVGVRIGNRILRRLFDGFVERRLFGPRFLASASRRVTPSWAWLPSKGLDLIW